MVIARRFSFIVAIYNYLRYQQYKTTVSAPRIVVKLGRAYTGARKRIMFKQWINLFSDSNETWYFSP